MTTHTTCRNMCRYAAAVCRPGAVVLSAAALAILSHDVRFIGATASTAAQQARSATISCLALIVATAAMIRLAINLRRVVRQPGHDEEAFERLAEMQCAARQPGCQLLEIHQIRWVTNAGQRAWVIDTANGAIVDHWFPGQAFAAGCFVLVRQDPAGGAVMSSLMPARVAAAGRHVEATDRRRADNLAAHRRRQSRKEHCTAKSVVESAERLLGP